MLRRLVGRGGVGASKAATNANASAGAVRTFGHAHPHPKHKPIKAPHAPRVTQLLIDGKASPCVSCFTCPANALACVVWGGWRWWRRAMD